MQAIKPRARMEKAKIIEKEKGKLDSKVTQHLFLGLPTVEIYVMPLMPRDVRANAAVSIAAE